MLSYNDDYPKSVVVVTNDWNVQEEIGLEVSACSVIFSCQVFTYMSRRFYLTLSGRLSS